MRACLIGQADRVPVARLMPALALAVAVLLLVGAAGVAVHEDTPGSSPPTTLSVSPASSDTVPGQPTTTAAKQQPLVSPELASLIARLEAFVEKNRGLKFKQPVKVTLLDEKAFRRRIADESKPDKAETDKFYRVLRALDLIDADVDLAKAQQALLGGAVVGYYDPKAKELFVRGAKPTPAVRQVLVHELTHALQDQHFNIERPELDKQDDEASQAWSGLLEGDAVRIERKYFQSLSGKDQDRAEKEQADGVGDLSDVPAVLIEALTFPYTVGPRFVQSVVEQGGQPRLDAAFGTGTAPTTSEQLIHPDKFLAGEGSLPVPEPAADGTVIDKGVFGEFGFIQQLERVVTDRNALFRATAGWGGDHYVAWDQGAKTCVRVDVVMDTPQDAEELRGALQQWIGEHSGASVTGTSPIRFTSCA
jgi:hypothetical protein